MKIGIIGAMNEEIELLQKLIDVTNETTFATITFYEGKISEKEVVLCKSGVGKVNAAITTQLLINQFSVEKIVFTGVAGALDPRLDIADIVISTSAMYHDMDASPLGFNKGVIPMFEHESIFKADKQLISIAENAAKQLGKAHVIKGRILSGDQFIASGQLVSNLHKEFNGVCVEMEGAAVAHVAMLNDIPFVIIRSMSDKANGEANISFNEFTKIASEQSYLIVKSMIESM